MAAPVWVDDVVALLVVVVAELLRMLVLEEIVGVVEEGAERVLAPEAEEIALLDVKLVETTVDVETDSVLEPPREVALATVVEEPGIVESPVELPANVEVPPKLEVPGRMEDPDVVELAEVEVPEPELPVMPSRLQEALSSTQYIEQGNGY
jgi:hypothetical protein